MSTNSIKGKRSLTLALRFNEKAAELLTDFANMRPDAFKRFEDEWSEKLGRPWYMGTGREAGAMTDPGEVQSLVREIWEGEKQGYEGAIVERGLSLLVPRQEEGWFDTIQQLFRVQWDEGVVWASPRDLGDYVWFSLLKYSQQLGICANKDNECPTPYFIRKKPNQKFCSEACALPSQREFKKQWFREHGDEWRKKWLKKKKRSRKSAKNTRRK
jgi:hypothetical protein